MWMEEGVRGEKLEEVNKPFREGNVSTDLALTQSLKAFMGL